MIMPGNSEDIGIGIGITNRWALSTAQEKF
jgi:hypothetical protein